MRPLACALVVAFAWPAFAQQPPPEEMPPVEGQPVPAHPPLPYPQPYEQPAPYPPPDAPPVVMQPPPMVVQPPPLVVQPPPLVVQPPPFVVQPPPFVRAPFAPPGCVVVVTAPPCPRSRTRRKGMFKLSLGYDARYAIGETLNAAASEVQVGGEKDGFGGAARLQVHAGRTDHGLTFEWIELGPAFEWTVSPRWRVGFGITNGALVIQRVARAPGPDMTAATWGAYFETTVDLAKAHESSSALYASARLGWDHLFDVTDLPSESVQGAIGLGYRY
jgi:hypothetical protein